MFSVMGLYALLTTVQGTKAARAAILDTYLAGVLRSLEPRSAG
jgi:hypothetical protein